MISRGFPSGQAAPFGIKCLRELLVHDGDTFGGSGVGGLEVRGGFEALGCVELGAQIATLSGAAVPAHLSTIAIF